LCWRVEQLGEVKAQQKTLEGIEKSIKADLIVAAAAGTWMIESENFISKVAFESKRKTDWPAVVEILKLRFNLDPLAIADAVADATSVAEGVPVVRIRGKDGRDF